jgi:sugar lactone lactonase YvrE
MRHLPHAARLPQLTPIFSVVLLLSTALSAAPERGPVLEGDQSFTTLATFGSATEGMTGDGNGILYTAGRTGSDCPVWRVAIATGRTDTVGVIPGSCTPAAMVLDSQGRLLVVDSSSGSLYRLDLSVGSPTTAAEVVASGMPGANGLALDVANNAFVSDGTTGQGRVWRVTPQAGVTEVFRVQAMASDVNAVDGAGGVGRDHRALPQGSIRISPTSRVAADSEGSQPIVANGLIFTPSGDLLVADTARGALWRASVDAAGNLTSPTGCDVAFPANTLCMSNVWIAHPLLEGADGIDLDASGNVWVTANERNAVLVVTTDARVFEAYRNPAEPESGLRNTGPLEFPTGIRVEGNRVCVSHTDTGRRDNAPPAAGELNPTGELRGKINCMDEALP